jgi:hypothetical protein
MPREPKSPNRFAEIPRDKPMGERTEHANLDRPGAQAHPQARRPGLTWAQLMQAPVWRAA